MSSTWLRNVSRSMRAATIVVFSNKSVHLENGRFVVTMVLLFLLRSEMTLNSNSDGAVKIYAQIYLQAPAE